MAAFEDRHEAHGIEFGRRLGSSEFEEAGEEIEVEALVITAAAGLDLRRPAHHERHAKAAIVVILLSSTPGIVVLGVWHGATVVGAEDDDGILLQPGVFEHIEHLADVVIEMLDEGHIHRPLLIELRRTLFDFGQPFGGRLDGKVRCIVGEVEEEGLRGLRTLAEVVRGPIGKELGGMALRLDDLAIEPHVVFSMAKVRGVAVHHVAEEAVEVVEAAFVRRVGRFEAEMPFADDAGVVARLLQFIRQRGHARFEVAPRVLRLRADHARHAHAIRVATREQGRTRRRAHGAIGPHRGEEHALAADAVDIRRANIRGMVSGDIAVAVIIGEDDQEVWWSRGEQAWNEKKEEAEVFHGLPLILSPRIEAV